MFDVLVAGAGPGGSVAAKRCAELGLKTLLVERRRLPRDKEATLQLIDNALAGKISLKPEYLRAL